jgi:hypothetical protein
MGLCLWVVLLLPGGFCFAISALPLWIAEVFLRVPSGPAVCYLFRVDVLRFGPNSQAAKIPSFMEIAN